MKEYFSHLVNSGQTALRKAAYGEALASMNEWEVKWSLSTAIKAGIQRKGAANNAAVICCVNILG